MLHARPIVNSVSGSQTQCNSQFLRTTSTSAKCVISLKSSYVQIFKMRAILYIAVLFICTFDNADVHEQTSKGRKQLKVKHLINKHNHRNKSMSNLKHTSKQALAFIFTNTTKSPISNKATAVHNLSKEEIRKKQKYLRKERAKLRVLLKNRRSHHSPPSEIKSIISKINEINEELKKYGSSHGRKHKHVKKPKNKVTENANILEITTARNKNYVFKWSLKNDTALNKIVSKLNKDPEQSFSNDNFKTQSDGFSPPIIEKHYNSSLIPNESKLPSTNLVEHSNELEILPTEPSISIRELASNITKHDKMTNGSFAFFSSKENRDLHNNTKISKVPNKVSNINYANLMLLESTTMPPVKNLSLDTIFNEFNAMNDQMNDVLSGVNKYPKINTTKDTISRKNINRCSTKKGGCEHICRPRGPNKCVCMPGFRLSSNKRSCLDINECSRLNGGCKGICNNTPGSYYCTCPDGLRLSDDKKSCEDINECLLRNGHGPCQDTCINTHSSYDCSCSSLTGTRLSDDKHSCEDINECFDNRIGCSHSCVNTLGRAYCTCPDGMMLSEDWKTCTDINECEDEDLKKLCKHGCINLIGSYRCIEAFELQSDQTITSISDYVACPPLYPPKHGFLECSRERGLEIKVKSKTGRRRVTNRPGTFCQLVCPDGYRSIGRYELTCGYAGQWFGAKHGSCQKS